MTATTHPPVSNSTPSDSATLVQYVSFWIDDQLLGVPVEVVQEVLNPQDIAPTPKARPEIAGLLNLRGQIVTAFDLRVRMGLPPRKGDKPCMNVVCRFEDESYSLLVDEVGDVIDVPADTMEPVPGTLDERWKSVTEGVYQLNDRLIVILKIDAILNLDAR
ncbi:chemotaxis protein CheW [Calycomorphotria hydatis]|uniref:Chemotaxis protein CheW n=1 Tax=Calycomorphotria hydatis TaxID=2528027 RepID=A0A517T798_9PLAN|nr:chemotaxis protein CheW [Calycomorphotria hydatis]QDT64254.1 Chemotaxis protein CheW [Calycomorphotria hydatis]